MVNKERERESWEICNLWKKKKLILIDEISFGISQPRSWWNFIRDRFYAGIACFSFFRALRIQEFSCLTRRTSFLSLSSFDSVARGTFCCNFGVVKAETRKCSDDFEIWGGGLGGWNVISRSKMFLFCFFCFYCRRFVFISTITSTVKYLETILPVSDRRLASTGLKRAKRECHGVFPEKSFNVTGKHLPLRHNKYCQCKRFIRELLLMFSPRRFAYISPVAKTA